MKEISLHKSAEVHYSQHEVEDRQIISLGTEVDGFIWGNLLLDKHSVSLLSTHDEGEISRIRDFNYDCIINLKRLNDARYLNKYFEAINSKLPQNGYLIGFVETKNQRKQRILDKYPIGISYVAYLVDFLVHRLFPRLRFTKKTYFTLTRGYNRNLTLSEILGRLVSCGFRVEDYRSIKGYTWFVASKFESPSFDLSPTYGPLCKIRRIGKAGKIISVYKIRTMHPYAEYLQEYLYQRNGTRNGDKINEDFRVTRWGKIMRKYWIDELPMLLNLIKGDLKLVGVRPLSQHKFGTYPLWLQQKRILTKPGLIPPFYADCPDNPEDFFESESKYIDAYLANPFKTDLIYFTKAMYNIFIKKVRSS